MTARKLADPAARMALWKGGAAAVDARRTDPMIVLRAQHRPGCARAAQAVRGRRRRRRRARPEEIAQARFAALGTSVYPDATFTLRLNYGTVQGWNENGKQVEPFTQLSRAFERATGEEPFRIPDSWMRAKDTLDLKTPFELLHQQRHRRRQFRQPADQREGRDRRA